ncbi:formate dehydrogenase, mitochondrial-like [Andrographis paniculata]|uniref:formate dehydrogenase, mitochondrial-like n=1 Tax=Andrographis paniculata TaxID=175694 RepID=UPI0021E7CFD9|nr:formate dehydrogenase, mitochondrial-like [Andrographis paniculata]
MATKRAAAPAVRAYTALRNAAPYSALARGLHATPGSKKIVGIFYKGHQYIVTDDKEGPIVVGIFRIELEKHIPDLHVLITTPFHPAYATAERIKNAQLLLTAGIGSDHMSISRQQQLLGLQWQRSPGAMLFQFAQDELMRVLILVRNFVPGHHEVTTGEWNVAGIAYRGYDLVTYALCLHCP